MATIELTRLGLKDYDELFSVLNGAFKPIRRESFCFETELPRMAHPTEEMMSHHFAIRENGKMAAALGVYPLPTVIGGKRFLFSTTGNVATLPEYRGKGYMSLLLNEAMKELGRIGADASRLLGKRERYNRYGFEQCGTAYRFTLKKPEWPVSHGIVFKKLEREDGALLDWAIALHRRSDFYALRETRDDFYDNYVNFTNTPYAAFLPGGQPAGVLSVSPDGGTINEMEAESSQCFRDILDAWRGIHGETEVALGAGMPEERAYLKRICEGYQVIFPSLFHIRDFAGITQALLDLKAKRAALPDYEKVLDITGYGRIAIRVRNGQGVCERTDAPAERTLTQLEAERFLFGTMDEDEAENAVLPLPLTWPAQDRV